MSRTFACLSVVIVLFSCNKHLKNVVSAGDCISGDTSFTPEIISDYTNYKMIVYENASLMISESGTPEIIQGDKLVFEYNYHKNPPKQKKDAGYNVHILFEVKPEGNSFLLSGDELLTAKATYGNLCFCPDAGYHLITEGCIKGSETGSGVWKVEMNITAHGKERVFNKMLSEKFTASK